MKIIYEKISISENQKNKSFILKIQLIQKAIVVNEYRYSG